jgi:polysaccharide export outer membrane protein
VTARGLTPQELASALTQSYRPFLKNPVITVNLLTPRPLRVGISGEVNRPGSYTITVSTTDSGNTTSTSTQWPDVTRALTVAGGITPLADIRNIRLRRVDATGNVQEQLLDLWQLLDGGDLSQNVLLRDGDALSIPKATSPIPADIARLGRASFAPDTIGVNVVGEVKAPGLIRLPPNATLNQALLAAGGFLRPRAVSSRVDLIRLNSDGTTTARRIPVDLKAGLNEDNNPILLANDIVVVNTNGVARVSDFLRIFLAPAGDLDTTRRFIDSLLNPPNQQ